MDLEITVESGHPARVTLHQPTAEFLAVVDDDETLARALGVPAASVVGGAPGVPRSASEGL